ncbi:MAG TPA: hypothetical protein VK750_06500, partial [Cytophagaceae bacterium]|nr:hypothetical protein [Cytophagaceae bacterium]
IELNSNLIDSQNGKKAADYFYAIQQKTEKDSTNAAVWLEAGNVFKDQYPVFAKDAYQQVLELDPGNAAAKKGLENLQ